MFCSFKEPNRFFPEPRGYTSNSRARITLTGTNLTVYNRESVSLLMTLNIQHRTSQHRSWLYLKSSTIFKPTKQKKRKPGGVRIITSVFIILPPISKLKQAKCVLTQMAFQKRTTCLTKSLNATIIFLCRSASYFRSSTDRVRQTMLFVFSYRNHKVCK